MPALSYCIRFIVASVSFAVALYPLDLIKVRMQVFDGAGSRYTSLASAFRSIVGQEGFAALYKVLSAYFTYRPGKIPFELIIYIWILYQGMGPGLIASVLSWGGYFYFYEQSKVGLATGRFNIYF